mmetsp:Transcript_34096/g.93692  ORF Transcript_34096/g.93692 Transcript_34096/m.93692 type:complete len:243 (+) Transcript_34096:1638-2366(+)
MSAVKTAHLARMHVTSMMPGCLGAVFARRGHLHQTRRRRSAMCVRMERIHPPAVRPAPSVGRRARLLRVRAIRRRAAKGCSALTHHAALTALAECCRVCCHVTGQSVTISTRATHATHACGHASRRASSARAAWTIGADLGIGVFSVKRVTLDSFAPGRQVVAAAVARHEKTLRAPLRRESSLRSCCYVVSPWASRLARAFGGSPEPTIQKHRLPTRTRSRRRLKRLQPQRNHSTSVCPRAP